MNIIIVNQLKLKINTKRLNKALNLIIATLSKKKVRNKKYLQQNEEIIFVFFNAAQMKKINFKYRKKNYATDVLSFQPTDENSFGELIFCLPVLKKQALKQGHSLDHELLYMIIHGVLHLLGYDHEKSKLEEKLMFDVQEACFQQLQHLKTVF